MIKAIDRFCFECFSSFLNLLGLEHLSFRYFFGYQKIKRSGNFYIFAISFYQKNFIAKLFNHCSIICKLFIEFLFICFLQ